MIKYLCLIINLFALINPVMGDVKIKGIVKDIEGFPIANVNISIEGSHAGTITDGNGSFSIDVKKTMISSDIVFSHIQYKTLKKSICDLYKSTHIVIVLEAQEYPLAEVSVLSPKKKSRWLKNGRRVPMVYGGMGSYDKYAPYYIALADSLAKLVGLPDSLSSNDMDDKSRWRGSMMLTPLITRTESITKKIRFVILKCTYDSITVRLHMYKIVDNDTLPIISPKNITIQKDKGNHKYEIDIEHLILNGGQQVLIGLEYVQYYGSGECLCPVTSKKGYLKSVNFGPFVERQHHYGYALLVDEIYR